MRLFLREHALLLVIQLLQFIVITGLFWLTGYRDMMMVLYAFLISCFIFGSYLMYYYLTRRKFYQRLEMEMVTLDDALKKLDDVPIANSLQKLLHTQYRLYKADITELELRQQEHLIFMDRWIHQMKTPLSVIELMATDLDEPLSSDMREETERMKTGLSTVLYMARLRSIGQDLQSKQINLRDLVQEVNQEHKRFFIRNKVYPVIESAENVVVETDEKWLYFIVTQLVQNAVKYSVNKANSVKIIIEQVGDQTSLEVQDFGVGIPSEDISRIFDAFFTGENGRKFRESTGMGLFLVREVANYLGHRIEVESAVDVGTSVRIVF